MTPIEKYFVCGQEVLVKREDLACLPPGPTFSKTRGLISFLEKRKAEGIKTVGYVETSVSMAGWGVAWACKQLKMKAVIFCPVYISQREDLILLGFHKFQWQKFGAEIVEIKAGMAKVNYNICKKRLREEYPFSLMLPLGLPLKETIDLTAEEVKTTQQEYSVDDIVVNVGSGTICAGVLKGVKEAIVYGIMGRTGDLLKKREIIAVKAGEYLQKADGFAFGKKFILIDPGYQYTEKAKGQAPFPCHPYYDLKAWNWLVENIKVFQGRKILFWNIGSLPGGVLL